MDLSKLKRTGWAKLNRTCEACKNDHADIEITFSCKGLPKNYTQDGTFVHSWHWDCLPIFLKEWQSTEERLMIETAMIRP